jgi:hypothetical protein
MKKFAFGILLGCASLTIGCGKSDPTASQGAQDGSGKPSATINEAAEAVAQFLDSARKGDDETVARLLTQKAKEELKKFDMEVAPPGAPEAQFEIGGTRFLDDDRDAGFVEVGWSEPNEISKQMERSEALIAVRKEAGGWRIAGMYIAGKPGVSQDQAVDFENLAELFAPQSAGPVPAGNGIPDPAASSGPSMAVHSFAPPSATQSNSPQQTTPVGYAAPANYQPAQTNTGYAAPNAQSSPQLATPQFNSPNR